MTKSKSDFLAHLQGIRAVAVILVLIFHYNSDNLPGGFIGVDMFFVVSGFIITRLILNEIKVTGRLNLFQFWERRIRRLLPAATVVLVTTLWLSILYIDETKLISIATQILYAAIYIVNWAFASQSVDYAERGSDLSPVLHYWSLSIEEQFYIGWPMLLALLAVIGRTHKSKLRLIATFISITTLLSFYWSVITSYSIDFKASYFTTTTRIWQLAVGGLVAIVLQKIDSSRSYLSQINSNKIFGLVVSWLGMLIIVWCSFRLNLDLRYPGSIALLPVIATVLLILSDKGGDWSLTPILEWKPVQYIGDISYSIYLWHWPVHIFLPLILQKYSLHLNQVWLYILVTFSLSVLSKHCIEDPFRYNLGFLKSLKHRNAYILGLLLITVTATFSLKIKSDTETQIEYAKALFLNSIDS
ncbi:MAG: acyltransferase, partial [Leptonema sp. (in: Bacteria)]|nr:acyltransferase [Leptonema sp. (in: bacteria)]